MTTDQQLSKILEWVKSRMFLATMGDSLWVNGKAYRLYEDEIQAVADKHIRKLIDEAKDEYPWHKIARHATYEIPIEHLGQYPCQDRTEYQECYLLPKRWVDRELDKLTKSQTELKGKR